MDPKVIGVKIQVSLTVPESKRLIGKGVANMDVVQKAYKDGIILLANGTTNAYVFEELTGTTIDKELSMCGFIVPFGSCLSSVRGPQTVILKGNVLREDSNLFAKYVMEMGRNDVYIKGANAIDTQGNAAIMFGDQSGMPQGPIITRVMLKGANFIIPVGLEKLIPTPLTVASQECGVEAVDYSMGMPVGLMPVTGRGLRNWMR